MPRLSQLSMFPVPTQMSFEDGELERANTPAQLLHPALARARAIVGRRPHNQADADAQQEAVDTIHAAELEAANAAALARAQAAVTARKLTGKNTPKGSVLYHVTHEGVDYTRSTMRADGYRYAIVVVRQDGSSYACWSRDMPTAERRATTERGMGKSWEREVFIIPAEVVEDRRPGGRSL